MRHLTTYHAEAIPDGVRLSRCVDGAVDQVTVSDWFAAVEWLVRPPADDAGYFTLTWNLHTFTKALFSLLPAEKRDAIGTQDRVFHDNVKIFYVGGRYLGLTATVATSPGSNLARRSELNLQSLSPWVSEDEEEPADVKGAWELGIRLVAVLGQLGFNPTKLTSPVGVFADCFLGDARKYPTLFNFAEEWFEAQEYALEIARHEWRSAYQVGTFNATHLFDLVSAYPAAIAKLPSTNDCRCEHATEVPYWAQWGVVYGEVEVDADVSPLVFDMGDGHKINPKGRWKGHFATNEIKWLERWGAGRFTIDDGWFFSFGRERPYKAATTWLHTRRTQYQQAEDRFAETVVKKMMQGLSGKLDEDRDDGKKGDFFNAVLAAMVRVNCRLRVGDFIYNNDLQDDLIAVLVDSVLSTQPVELPDQANGMGSWRYDGCLPAVVLSKGMIWRPGKRPYGISYDDLVAAMVADPESGYYEFTLPSGTRRSVDLMLDAVSPDRIIDGYPECGREIMERVTRSRPIILA